jgi:hypothetical protein
METLLLPLLEELLPWLLELLLLLLKLLLLELLAAGTLIFPQETVSANLVSPQLTAIKRISLVCSVALPLQNRWNLRVSTVLLTNFHPNKLAQVVPLSVLC